MSDIRYRLETGGKSVLTIKSGHMIVDAAVTVPSRVANDRRDRLSCIEVEIRRITLRS